MRELRQADAGRSHVGRSANAGKFADLRLVEAGVRQRRRHLVLLGGVLAGTIIAQIVRVHPVDDVLVTARAAHLLQTREQLVLAVEAAVGIVAGVIGIVELGGPDVLVHDAESLDERLGVALVGFGKRGRVGGDGDGVGTEHAVGGPGQVGRIGAARESHNHAAHAPQIGEELLLFFEQARRG